jgi:hypothetical protein
LAKRAINGAKTSAHDLIIDVGILSTGDDFPDIELMSFSTSSTEGGSTMLKNSPVCLGSAYSASVSLPKVDMRDRMFDEMLRILVMKKSASESHRSLLLTGVIISGACVVCSTSQITDHFRCGLESAARNRSVYIWRREFIIASFADRQAARYFIRSFAS